MKPIELAITVFIISIVGYIFISGIKEFRDSLKPQPVIEKQIQSKENIQVNYKKEIAKLNIIILDMEQKIRDLEKLHVEQESFISDTRNIEKRLRQLEKIHCEKQ